MSTWKSKSINLNYLYYRYIKNYLPHIKITKVKDKHKIEIIKNY